MIPRLTARPLVPGTASGIVLRSHVPLSLWGGVDPSDGTIIDRRHDRCGEAIAGRVLVLPAEKGSSTASAVLVELVRVGCGPAAIVASTLSPILALGAIVAELMYGVTVPVLRVSEEEVAALEDGLRASVEADGTIRLASPDRSSR